MLANYRCNEIKDQTIVFYEKDLNNFVKNSNNSLLSNFRIQCEKLREKILETYDEFAKNYFERIYKEVREHLDSHTLNIFYIGFTNQGRLFIPLAQKNLIKEIDKELLINENFSKVVEKLKKNNLEHFTKYMSTLQISKNWDLNINSVIEIFDDVINFSRKQRLDEKKKDHIVNLILILEKNKKTIR